MSMLFEARFKKQIRKDGWVSCGSDCTAYIIAENFIDATGKAAKAFEEWKNEDKERKDHVLESITLIDDKPIF